MVASIAISQSNVRAASSTGAGVSGPPDLTASITAALRAARWVDAFDVPAPDDANARLAIPGATAVRAAVRLRGRPVGAATEIAQPFGRDDFEAQDAAADLLVRRATGAALAASLADPTVAAARELLDDASAARPVLTLELEIAGALTALPGRTFEAAVESFEPGMDGLALRRGDDVAMVFPGEMMHDGSASYPLRAMSALCAGLAIPFAPYEDLRRTDGVRLYRFRTRQFAQVSPGASPEALTRADTVVRTSSIDLEWMQSAGRDLVAHLGSLLLNAEVGLRGNLDAATNTHVPLVASPRDQMLTAFALARWARSQGADDSIATTARALARVLLEANAVVVERETDPLDDPVAAAALVLAELELERVPPHIALEGDAAAPSDPPSRARAALRTDATARLQRLVALLAASHTGTPPPLPPPGADPDALARDIQTLTDLRLSALDQAVVVFAVARRLELLADPPADELVQARHAVDATMALLEPADAITMMPWIAWADVSLVGVDGMRPEHQQVLRQLRAALAASQLDRSASADVSGGFRMGGTPIPIANAQSLRPTLLLAWMSGQDGLTAPTEREETLLQLRRALRFVAQLTIDFQDRWRLRRTDRAVGGIRAAPWDLRMPTAAQAIGLLVLAEAADAWVANGPAAP